MQNEDENYTLWVLIKEMKGEFSIIYFLIVMIVIMWLRFLLMLQLTKTFGPLLRTSIVMLGDAFKFLFIWLVVLFLLSSIASLLFGDIEGQKKFLDVVLYSFGTGLGGYDFTIFQTSGLGR